MTDLNKRLLSWSGTPFDDDAHEAADRIEELMKERDFILANQTYSYLGKNLKRWLARDLEDAKDAAEAKLTKAVEAIEMMLHRYLLYCGGDAMPFGGHTDQKIVESVRATLAEVKGESHE